jgi:4-hydroxy-tetrahydrodipicolinate synthase
MMEEGAKGAISVTANIAPADVSKMTRAALQGDKDEARSLHEKLLPLHDAMFLETNPQPAKIALKMMGRGNGEFRLPLWGISPENEEKLKAALTAYGLL